MIFVPIPDYIPTDNHWKLVAKQTTHSWGRPCIYVRYEVDKPQLTISKELKKIISQLHKWQRTKEYTSDDLLSDVSDFYKDDDDSEIPIGEVPVGSLVRLNGGTLLAPQFGIETKNSFVFFSWFKHGEQSNHKTINVRVIDSGKNKCIVEIWDFLEYDD